MRDQRMRVLARSGKRMPHCSCGCESVTHIHASLGHRDAPTGVLHHKMPKDTPDRYFKLNRLDTKLQHTDGHDCSDLELLYTFACYDESPNPTVRLPLPRTIKWENFLHENRVQEGCEALRAHSPPMGTEPRLVNFPQRVQGHKGGTAVRFGDRVLLAMRLDGALKLFEVDVVGTAPAVGIFVVTSKKDLPELRVQESEPMFAAEVNIVQQCRGDHWMTEAQMEEARREFDDLERQAIGDLPQLKALPEAVAA